MADSGSEHTVFKIALFLGIIAMVSSTLTQPWVYVGQPIPPASTWGQMQSQITNFPQYVNPFAPNTVEFIHVPTGNDYFNSTNLASVFGCANATYYRCLQSNDANTSYITLNAAHPNVETNMTLGVPAVQGIMRQFVITLMCRSINAPVSLSRVFSGGQYVDTPDACPLNQFKSFSYNMPAPWAYNSSSAALNTNMVGVNINAGYNMPPVPTNGSVQITYMEVDIYSDEAASVCSGNWLSNIACTLGNFAQTVFKGILAFVNGIVFAASVIFWFISLVGLFFGSIFGILTIPGEPPIVSGLVGVLILGLILFMALYLMGKAKPTGG